MSDMIGLSPSQMRELATKLGGIGTELSQMASTLTSKVVQTQWKGQRREAFVDAWKGPSGYESTLKKLGNDIAALKTELTQLAANADELLNRRG